MKNEKRAEIPTFEPTETESINEIPERFLVDGYLSLTKDGRWLFKGDEIEHRGIQLFLSKQLQRTKEGAYWVVNGPQRVLVELKGAPYHVIFIRKTEDEQLELYLNDGSYELLDPTTLHIDDEEEVFARVKKGQAGAEEGETHLARFSREAVFQLEPFLVEKDEKIGLELGGRFYPIEEK